jgi:hypothetical protein
MFCDSKTVQPPRQSTVNQSQLKRLGQKDVSFFKYGFDAFKSGQYNKAGKIFQKMLGSQAASLSEIERAGLLLSENQTHLNSITVKLLEKALELGSQNAEVYYQLAEAYLQKHTQSIFPNQHLRKAEKLVDYLRNNDPKMAQDLRLLQLSARIYVDAHYRDSDKAIEFGLNLANSPDQAVKIIGEHVVTHRTFRWEFVSGEDGDYYLSPAKHFQSITDHTLKKMKAYFKTELAFYPASQQEPNQHQSNRFENNRFHRLKNSLHIVDMLQKKETYTEEDFYRLTDF